jgi:hypothetical protein
MRTDGSTPVTGPNAHASAGVNLPVPEPTSSPASGRRSGSTAAKALIHSLTRPDLEVEPMWWDRLRASTIVAPGAAAVELGLQVARAVVS